MFWRSKSNKSGTVTTMLQKTTRANQIPTSAPADPKTPFHRKAFCSNDISVDVTVATKYHVIL